jgi:hypothetical protein
MIKTYGLHWRVDQVNWGKPGKGNSGTLLGAERRSKNAPRVNFRRQRGVYVLYSEYEIVYIGQTGAGNDRLFRRLKRHRSDHLSERWDRFSWFGTQAVIGGNKLKADNDAVKIGIPDALDIMEAVAIAISEPRLNLKRGNWGAAKQYFQVPKDVGFEDEEDEEG